MELALPGTVVHFGRTCFLHSRTRTPRELYDPEIVVQRAQHFV
jgi:hypothetical protein